MGGCGDPVLEVDLQGKMYTRVFSFCPLTLLPLPPAAVRIKTWRIMVRIEVSVVAG